MPPEFRRGGDQHCCPPNSGARILKNELRFYMRKNSCSDGCRGIYLSEKWKEPVPWGEGYPEQKQMMGSARETGETSTSCFGNCIGHCRMRGRGRRFDAHTYADTRTYADPYAHANARQPVPKL